MSFSSLEHSLANTPLFFLHIPKTAGTTLIQVIERQFDEHETARWLYPFRLVDAPRDFFSRHRYFHGHVDYALMRSLMPQAPVSMTVLRQPVERYLSHFGNHKRVAVHQIPDISNGAYAALSQTSLEDFVGNPPQSLAVLSQYFQNLQTKLLASELVGDVLQRNEQIRTNQYILTTPSLEQARQRLETFEFIGLTERFQDSLFLLAYTFGWFPATVYQNFNTSQPRPQQHTLSDDILEEIENVNLLDQQVYEHGRKLFESRYEQMQQELLSHYGSRRHAHESLPLKPDIIAELLDRHYQQRFVERSPPVHAIKLECNQKMPGGNWHLSEQHPVYGSLRWSGPGSSSFLDFPLASDAPLLLRFSVALAITPEVLSSLTVTVNGVQVSMDVETLENHVRIFHAYLSESVLGRHPGFVRVVFDVKETLRPIDFLPDSADQRLLGICLNWVEFLPVAPPE